LNSFLPKSAGLHLTFSLLVGLTSLAQAEESETALPGSCPGRVMGAVMPPAPDRQGQPVVMFARYLDAGIRDLGEAREQVEIFHADQHLSTERVLYDSNTKDLTFPQPVSYEDQQLWISGQDAVYNFQQEEGYFSTIDYGLTGSSANGSADRIELKGGHTSQLYKLVYSTCPEEKPDWSLTASELQLRHDEGIGVARGAKLTFKGVPILYAPYFTFPIDERRKTGFLYPGLSNTNDNGLEISVPWYWNISANQDATLEPRYLTSRGFMLSGEYRFLTRRTHGSLDFDYLPDDDQTGDSRYRYRFEHHARPWDRWRTGLVLDRVGDNQYYQDFGSGLDQTSLQFLYSNASLSGVGRYWNVEMLVDKFQVIDESVQPQNEPYRRLPRIAFWMDRPFGVPGMAFKLNTELVYFDRDVGTTGTRLDLQPSLYWEQRRNWGFIKPSIAYRFTGYNLDNIDLSDDDSPSRGTEIISLDAGLYFDRMNAGGSTQTLEPRIFYLYVPYEQQSDLPRFDTAEFTFGFSQLFNTNRFTGADRQSDANQISLAVSSRNFSSSAGSEQWSVNVGQIFYIDPLRVQLGAQEEKSLDYSPLIAEFTWHAFRSFNAHTGVQWSWEDDRLDVASFGVAYTGKSGQRASFDYRFRRDRVDQFDLKMFWPINEKWRVMSRVNYSFSDNDLLEVQAGIEYESCCWAFRTLVRRYLKNQDGEYRDGIFLELNLKGLGSIGTRARDLFTY
jgi:LPS-assembly protein